jgi:hypothetical protein
LTISRSKTQDQLKTPGIIQDLPRANVPIVNRASLFVCLERRIALDKMKPAMNHRKRNTLCFRLPNGLIWTVVAGNAVPNAFPGYCPGCGIRRKNTSTFGFFHRPTIAQLPERVQIL